MLDTVAPWRCPPYPGVADTKQLWCPCCHARVPETEGIHTCDKCMAKVRVMGADLAWLNGKVARR